MILSRFKSVGVLAIAGIVVFCGVRGALAQEPAAKAADPIYLDEPAPPPKPKIVQEVKALEKYDDGKTRVERQVRRMSDDSIMNHGKFTEFYQNGNKFAEGNFKDGVQDGQWSYWHENGQLCKTVNFINGQPDGAWETHRADGTLESQKSYKEGKRNGQWVLYFEDGKTKNVEQNFADNKLDGQVTLYFKNGKPKIQTSFKAGSREGASTEWDDSGRKTAEATYVDNKLDGKVTRYNADGTKNEEFFRQGKRVQAPAA